MNVAGPLATGVGFSAHQTLAVFVIIVPLSSGRARVARKVTVMGWPTGALMPVAICGGVPGVPPADAGAMVTLPGTNVSETGNVSLTTTPVAGALPVFVSTIVYVTGWPGTMLPL